MGNANRIAACLLLTACDMPSSGDCLPGRDVSDWAVVEKDRSAVTTPIRSCGRTVGYEIKLPDGEHANVMVVLEKQFTAIAGERVRFGVDINATPQANGLRVSMDEVGPSPGVRTEFGFAEAKPAKLGRADITYTRVGQPGLYRVVRLIAPQFGAWTGRLTGFEW